MGGLSVLEGEGLDASPSDRLEGDGRRGSCKEGREGRESEGYRIEER